MYLAPLDEYIVDFYGKDLLLAIDVNGHSHDFKRDRDGDRQRRLESLGIRFLRFWENEVKTDVGSVVRTISDWIGEHQSEFVESKNRNSLGAVKEPTPNPSKGGS